MAMIPSLAAAIMILSNLALVAMAMMRYMATSEMTKSLAAPVTIQCLAATGMMT